jgi:hypothetical protein
VEGNFLVINTHSNNRRSWLWFSDCLSGDGYWHSHDAGIHIGLDVRIVNNIIFIGNCANQYGKEIATTSKYTGQYRNCLKHGFGVLEHDSGVKYEGEWKYGLMDGSGSLIYSDGIKLEGNFNLGYATFDTRHPLVAECVKNKKCTRLLPMSIPQRTEGGCCETCWAYCCGIIPPTKMIWEEGEYRTDCSCSLGHCIVGE